jgi:IS30 family transposase
MSGIREYVRQKKTAKRRRQPRKIKLETKLRIIQLRQDLGWCGQKIRKELKEVDGLTVSLMTIYRVLHLNFKVGSKWKKYKSRGEAPQAHQPREVVQHDTVDFGGLFAHTSIDIFTKEPVVVMVDNLTSQTGIQAFRQQKKFFGVVKLHQSDEGPEFKGKYVETVKSTGASHRYARPYKKNDQAQIENFNRSLRKECLGWGKYCKKDKKKIQAKVDRYVHHFIYERWHMGLPDIMTPNQFITWYNAN